VTIEAEPVKPRAAQTGLFIPLAPEPEKLEITLARLAKLVGPEMSDRLNCWTHIGPMRSHQALQTHPERRKESSF
jgi:hypothetical protein